MTKNGDFQMTFKPLGQWIWARAAPQLVACAVLGWLHAGVYATTHQTQSGVVTHVVDGDTVWVRTSDSQPPLKLRIQGIDAPEICQAGGLEAQNALKTRVLGQRVSVTSRAHDDYGRTVGTLYWQGQDVGRWLVANGHAWVYSYHHKKAAFSDEFNQARSERRGLFQEAEPQEPRAFRRTRGSCYSSKKRASSYKKSSGF